MERRNRYGREFEQEGVRLASPEGVSVPQVDEDVGVNAEVLGRWTRQFGAQGVHAFPGRGEL